VANTPSSALGSTRDKPDIGLLPGNLQGAARAPDRALLLHRRQRLVGHGAHRQRGGAAAGYPLRCIHIPKTIDNDLVDNDHTPGFPSAARFVAQAFAGANLDNAALPGVYVGVVMGRHAGFLTAAAALGQEVCRRRPAPDLPARARVRARAVPGRREGHLRTPTAAA
jgi:hypothetical protein